jgi:predicted amidohydrolase
MTRREFAGSAALTAAASAQTAGRKIPVALVQFDSVPEQAARNLGEMERLAGEAAKRGVHWIMFHEGTLCDYTPRLDELAERVPEGAATARMMKLAKSLGCFLSFGLSERDRGRFYIAQVFVGPKGYVYHYRKTWIWRDAPDDGYRNEWARYDPGTGPEPFRLDGVRATCFICADGEAPRCIARAAETKPQIVFYPNNRGSLPDFPVFGERARKIGAPMLVTNRTGNSWTHATRGGCVVFSASGEVLAKANREGREEILLHELEIPG